MLALNVETFLLDGHSAEEYRPDDAASDVAFPASDSRVGVKSTASSLQSALRTQNT